MWILKTKAFGRLVAVFRAGTVLTVMLTIVSLVAARRAHAEVAKAGIKIGKDLVPLAAELGGGATVKLNGQRLLIKYDGSEKTVRAVLDDAEAACRAGGVAGPRIEDTTPSPLRLVDFGVVRREEENDGVVLCFARGAEAPGSLTEQVRELKKTGDLGSLGKMRYVYARKDGDTTAVLAAVTDDSFSLRALEMKSNEDSPGSDDPSIPRPLDSTRFLSAELEGTPYATRGYRTRVAPEVVREDFERGMAARGFRELDLELRDGTKATSFHKDGVFVTFDASKNPSGDTIVSIGSMGVDAPAASERVTRPVTGLDDDAVGP